MKAKKRITVRMSKELNETLSHNAERLGVSKNALILQILWDKVENKEAS